MPRGKKEESPPEDSTFKVSQSKLNVKRRCNQAYHYRYVEKLRKKTKSRPLQFGTIVHSMLEAYAEGDDPLKKLQAIAQENKVMFASQREEYGEIIEDIRQIMTEYFLYYPEKDLRLERHDKKSGEFEFNVDLGVYDPGLAGIIWNGKIDAVGKTPNKLRWIVEHKTFSRKPNDDERWRNLQSSTYIKVVEELGWGQVDGMCWDYIKSKPPTKPSLLKDGSLSQKNIDTLPITVKETLEELGLKARDYKSFLKRAEEGREVWFQRIHTPVNPEVVASVMEDFLADTRRMADEHGRVRTKHIGRHCSWCDFEGLCRAELQGLDVDYVKQADYTTRRDNEKESKLADSAD